MNHSNCVPNCVPTLLHPAVSPHYNKSRLDPGYLAEKNDVALLMLTCILCSTRAGLQTLFRHTFNDMLGYLGLYSITQVIMNLRLCLSTIRFSLRKAQF